MNRAERMSGAPGRTAPHTGRRWGVALSAVALVLTLTSCGGGGSSTGAGTPAAGTEPTGRIVFVSFRDGDQEIYIVNPDGSGERNLTENPADDFDPDLSEDGAQLAFVSKRAGPAQVFVMNMDGSGLRQVTQGNQGGLAPRWSHDGKKIAYSWGGSLAVVNVDGSGQEVIMEPMPDSQAEPCRSGSYPGGWSPDDSEITYYSASVTRQEAQVCAVSAGGADVEVVVAEPGAYVVEPAWSPDGREILYRAVTAGVHDIWIVNVESGERTNVSNDPDLDVEPAWSPDGQWIVYSSLKPGMSNSDIYVMSRDGSDRRRLTKAEAKDAYPAWAP